MRNTAGVEYLALRPLLSDYVMSMPRGAAVVYPKDAGQIVTMADVFPGARVVEAGVGSGRAVDVAAAGGRGARPACTPSSGARTSPTSPGATPGRSSVEDHPAWRVTVGDLVESLPTAEEPGSVDRVVLDMLAPWECLDVVADALAARRRPHLLRRHRHPAVPGGRGACATTAATPSRRPGSRSSAAGTSRVWPSGPQHRMHGHTGFLITTRRLAPGVTPPLRKRRPAKGSTARTARSRRTRPSAESDSAAEDVGERVPSDKKIRRLRRSVTQTSPTVSVDRG